MNGTIIVACGRPAPIPTRSRRARSIWRPLADYGVPSEAEPATASNIEAAVREGNVVITPVYSDFQPQAGQKHVVLTVGIEYDDDGRPVAAYVNDSGVPNGCLRRVPWPSYVAGLEKSDSINIVKTGASP